MNHRNTTITGLTFCLLLAFILSSCDNSIMNSVGERAGYSIYGVFRLKADTNYLRIKNMNVPLVLNSKHTLNATVHLKNLKTGRSYLLTKDSLVNFNGVVIHNFKVTIPIQPLTTYKVIVKSNSGGHKTTAQVTTPLPFSMSISPRVDSCGTTRTVKFGKLTTGETLIGYAVAAHKFVDKGGPPKVGDQPTKPPKHFFIRKRFTQFPGKLGSKSFGYQMRIRFPCHLEPSEIHIRYNRSDGTLDTTHLANIPMYAAVYGSGYDKNKPVPPDSVTNIDRFLKSKLLAVVIDTVSFVAILPDYLFGGGK